MALTSLDRLGDYLLVALLHLDGNARPAEALERFGRDFGSKLTIEDEAVDDEYTEPRPVWHRRAHVVLRRLIGAGWVTVDRRRWALTPAGRTVAEELEGVVGDEHHRPRTRQPDDVPLLRPSVLAGPLLDPDARARIGLPMEDDLPLPMLVELNVLYRAGVEECFARLQVLTDGRYRESMHRLSEDIVAVRMPMNEVQRLIEADMSGSATERLVHRVWPDFPVNTLVDESARTIKSDAARRSFSAFGEGIVWAVIDSGIDRSHPHFQHWLTVDHDDVRDLHRDFTVSLTQDPGTAGSALVDERGHGTHVAGIIAGQVPAADSAVEVRVMRDQFADAERNLPGSTANRSYTRELLAGMAPRARLVSLKALPAEEDGATSRVIAALRYIREVNAASDRLMRIHGVNLSVGYEFDPEWFACGQSPLCKEVDRLVRSGVVVVVAAGNTGYGRQSASVRQTRTGLSMTINDPGNAERAITVGATHRDRPHTYGVSYFSSKGPTGDGRLKPDLVAPGERIASCAAGAKARNKVPGGRPQGVALYIEDTGTSMAAPHVAGAIAAFLSARPEFIGQPERVKEIFCRSATSLGREHYFQGAGLVDLMRALQEV